MVGAPKCKTKANVDNRAVVDYPGIINPRVPNRIIVIHPNGEPVNIELLDADGGIGMEIFDHMEGANGPNIHEILWNPDTLYQWCVTVCHIGHWLDRRGGLARCSKATFVFSAARFGQAVMCGANKTALRAAWEEVRTECFRNRADWYKLINPLNNKLLREEVSGSNLYTHVPVPRDDGAGYEFRDVPDVEILGVACEILEGWHLAVLERQKKNRELVRSQAIVGIVCTLDSNEEDQRCTICLDSFATISSSNASKDGASATHLAVRTTCNHLFGFSCFSSWMKDHERCPVCRQKLIGKGRLRHPRDQEGAIQARKEPTTERIVNTTFVRTVREGLLAGEGISLDAEQHVVCKGFIAAGRMQDAYDILLQQLKALKAIDEITDASLLPMLEGYPALTYLVCTSFRDDWCQFFRNVSRLMDHLCKKTGDWSDWSNLQIKELRRVSIECKKRLLR
jgi:hypothetical protein